MSEVNYIEVEFDGETYRRVDNKRACTFPKLVTVQLDGEEVTTKLSYTTVYFNEHGEECANGPDARDKVLKPCVRIGGVRYNLDDERILVAEESVIV